jgi:predicted dehydrogenase
MRIAVLGCGSIGKRHLRNLLTEGKHELLPFDPNPDARAHVESLLKIKTHSSLESLWEANPHIALICAPPHRHLELALKAAEQGAHLFIEKPVADRLDGINQLQALVGSNKLITMVGCNMRFHPGPARVKALLEQRAIGAILAARIQTGSYLPDWRPATDFRKSYTASRQQGGGAILDCIHELDLAIWYFGPASVFASVALPSEKLGIEVEGLAEILLRHSNGVLSSVHLNFVQRDYRRLCQIIGETGSIYWDFDSAWVEIRNGAGLERRFDLDPEWNVNQMYVDELRHFLQCVERNEATSCPLDQGIAVLKIALNARELALGIPAASNS